VRRAADGRLGAGDPQRRERGRRGRLPRAAPAFPADDRGDRGDAGVDSGDAARYTGGCIRRRFRGARARRTDREPSLFQRRMNLLVTIAAFLVALGVLIVVHEYGHYLVARVCGVKVLRFSVGFGKPLWVFRRGPDRTEWVIAALPFGG